ncbi:MAG: anti-FecI sigma factor FecR [Sphingobacteriales bacterium]|nr:anti-FecI sigma factor FecR [Sphingobacteriales bacterium]
MDKHYFLKLLRKQLKGTATAEEEQFLISYYNLFQNEPDVIALLSEENQTALKDEMKLAIWENIEHEDRSGKVRSIKDWRERIAAAAVILAICTIGLLYSNNYFTDKPITEKITVVNNKSIEKIINLPDGSIVKLGSGSKINYSSTFTDLPQRDVYLEGGAFFDVVHDKTKSFIVHTGKVHTTVLGTAFSVEAFSWEKDITVTVNRGKVAVSDQLKLQGFITPDQQIKYSKVKASSTHKVVDADHYLNWNGARLVFDDVTVEEAVDVLQKKFGIKISINNSKVMSKRFTSSFNANENIEKILKSICEFNGAVFSYNKSNTLITITKN